MSIDRRPSNRAGGGGGGGGQKFARGKVAKKPSYSKFKKGVDGGGGGGGGNGRFGGPRGGGQNRSGGFANNKGRGGSGGGGKFSQRDGRKPNANFKRYKDSMEVVGATVGSPFDFRAKKQQQLDSGGGENSPGQKRSFGGDGKNEGASPRRFPQKFGGGGSGKFQRPGGQKFGGKTPSPRNFKNGFQRSTPTNNNNNGTGVGRNGGGGGKRFVGAEGDFSSAAKRKRVSFSNNLEHSRTIEEVAAEQQAGERKLSDASPGKGILRVRKSGKTTTISADGGDSEDGDGEERAAKPEPTELPALVFRSYGNKGEQGGGPPKGLKVTRATKEQLAKMDKRSRKEFIRKLKEKKHANYSLATEAKALWEKIRSKKCKADEREKCVKALMELVKGKLKSIIYAHDTSRVVECLMALEREDVRSALFNELAPEIVHMAKSTYARFFLTKMLKYGTKHQREVVINAFKGHCVSLFKISSGAKILELVFNDYANAVQRFNIVSEFYGPEYVIFRDEMAQLKSLDGIIKKYPEKAALILKNLDDVLEKVVTKETLKLSLTHKLLHDYLRYCTADQRASIIDSLKTNLPEIAHTIDGSKAAMICVWNAGVKERKAIVKSFKGVTLNACKDQYACRVLFAIFDSVDDTALVNKYITTDISNNMAELAYDKWGASVLHYLIHPRDVRYFSKWIVPAMSEGDSNEHSKKAKDVRYAELFQCISKNLCAFLAANMPTILMSKEAATLVLDTLEPSKPTDPFQRVVDEEDKIACFKAICEVLAGEIQPYNMEEKEKPHILRFGPPRYVFRKLMSVEPQQRGARLSDHIADLPREHLAAFLTLECGCFALVEVLQSGSERGRRAVLDAVNLAALKESKLMGARVLLDEVTQCLAAAKTTSTTTPSNGPKKARR